MQVTQEIASAETRRREHSRLLAIDDNYLRYVLLNGDYAGGNYQGIRMIYIADFLLSGEF